MTKFLFGLKVQIINNTVFLSAGKVQIWAANLTNTGSVCPKDRKTLTTAVVKKLWLKPNLNKYREVNKILELIADSI